MYNLCSSFYRLNSSPLQHLWMLWVCASSASDIHILKIISQHDAEKGSRHDATIQRSLWIVWCRHPMHLLYHQRCQTTMAEFISPLHHCINDIVFVREWVSVYICSRRLKCIHGIFLTFATLLFNHRQGLCNCIVASRKRDREKE